MMVVSFSIRPLRGALSESKNLSELTLKVLRRWDKKIIFLNIKEAAQLWCLIFV